MEKTLVAVVVLANLFIVSHAQAVGTGRVFNEVMV
jgi:hypothetical protein